MRDNLHGHASRCLSSQESDEELFGPKPIVLDGTNSKTDVVADNDIIFIEDGPPADF